VIYGFYYKISNLYTTIIAELYTVFIPSELQHSNITYRKQTSVKRTLPNVCKNKENTDPCKEICCVPKCRLHSNDYILPLVRPWITNHSLQPTVTNFSRCTTTTVIKLRTNLLALNHLLVQTTAIPIQSNLYRSRHESPCDVTPSFCSTRTSNPQITLIRGTGHS